MEPGKDQLESIWFRLPPRFFKRLRRVANEWNIDAEEVLSRGVDLVAKQLKNKRKEDLSLGSRAAAVLVGKRWIRTTVADRRKIAQELAKKRWSVSASKSR